MVRNLFHFLVMMLAVLSAQLAGMAPASAQASVAAPTQPVTPPAAVSAAPSYILGSGDVVEVAIVGSQDGVSRVQVQSDGTIQLPLIGSVMASGKSPLQLRDEVRARLQQGGYYVNPAVNVTVATFASRYVVVLGEVNSPGLVPIDRAYRLSEIIARVGGLKGEATDRVTLRRETGEEQSLSISAIATGGTAEDPVVAPGDKIFVPRAETFYIYGQVMRPGNYAITADMTLRKALAVGGGLTPLGSEKKVKLIRADKENSRVNPSTKVQAGDVIVVGERFF